MLSEVKFMPSEKVLESKKARVAELSDLLKNASAGVIVDYKGITVETIPSSDATLEKP